MAGNKIKVNTSRLDQTRGELQSKLENIKKNVEQITDDMNTLNSMWEGDAHQAFAQQVSQDIDLLNAACDCISGIIGYESNAVTEYNKCEQKVSELVAQIKI